MNDFKTSGCEAPKTPVLHGADYLEKFILERNESNSIDFEDVRSVVFDCNSMTFLTDCTKIELKGDSLSEFIKKVKKIIINGVSFAKEGE